MEPTSRARAAALEILQWLTDFIAIRGSVVHVEDVAAIIERHYPSAPGPAEKPEPGQKELFA